MNPIGPVNGLYPMPTTLVGATVNGKPNLKLHQVLDFEPHDIFVGELIQTCADPGALKGGKIDVEALRPLLFDMAGKKYGSLGPAVGNCWHAGKALKNERGS